MEEVENITFLQVLKLHHVELWHTKNNCTFVKDAGDLQVIYSKPEDIFILKIDNFKFALDKSLQVIGTFDEKEKFFSYIFPSFSGFYIFKVNNPELSADITNFETILQNRCQFTKKSGLEERINSYKPKPKPEGGILEKSGEAIKEGFLKTADKIMQTFTHAYDNHPNQKIPRDFEELLDLDSHGVNVIDLSKNEVRILREEAADIARDHQESNHWRGFRDDLPMGELEQDLMNLDMDSSKAEGTERRETKAEDTESLEKPQLNLQGDTMDPSCEKNEGADNINTVQQTHATDSQEVVGSENQRLPQYEIQHSKERLESGFRRASVHCQGGIQELAPCSEEDTTFTTGLLSGSLENMPKESPLDDIPRQPMGESLGTRNHFGDPNAPAPKEEVPTFSEVTSGAKKDLEIPFSSNENKEDQQIADKSDADTWSTTSQAGSTMGDSNILGSLGNENVILPSSTADKDAKRKKAANQPLDKENVGSYVV